MADEVILAHWYEKPISVRGIGLGSLQPVPRQKKCASGKEAAAYIMEEVTELDRTSVRIVFSNGASLGFDDMKRIYEANKSAGRN